MIYELFQIYLSVSKDFGGDADQMKAAQMMTEKPVIVLSGPGGCGKTYVVSKLLSQVVVKCPLHSVDKSSSGGPLSSVLPSFCFLSLS